MTSGVRREGVTLGVRSEGVTSGVKSEGVTKPPTIPLPLLVYSVVKLCIVEYIGIDTLALTIHSQLTNDEIRKNSNYNIPFMVK